MAGKGVLATMLLKEVADKKTSAATKVRVMNRNRVKESVTKFLETKLKLKVNYDKSGVSRLWLRNCPEFLYFQMCGQYRIRTHVRSLKRFKGRVIKLTSRNRGKSLKQII